MRVLKRYKKVLRQLLDEHKETHGSFSVAEIEEMKSLALKMTELDVLDRRGCDQSCRYDIGYDPDYAETVGDAVASALRRINNRSNH